MNSKTSALPILMASLVLFGIACGSGAAGIGGGAMPDDEFAVTFCLVLFEQENRALAVDTDWFEVWGNWETERQAIQSELKRLEALSPSSKFKDYYQAQVAKTEFYRDYAEAQPPETSSKTAKWRNVMRDPESRTAFEEIFAEIRRTKQELSGEALSTLKLYNCS